MSSTSEDSNENLPKMFQDALDLYNDIDKTNEPTNSFEVQANIKRAMSIFEKATRLVSIAGLFSTNESIDEVATSDLQFLMLPALLGTLSLKITSGERRSIVECAEIYFKDFLQRTNNYGLSDYTFKEELPPGAPSTSNENKTNFDYLKGMVQTRQTKIERFKEQKELQSKLEEFKSSMGNENVDDEIKRQYLLTMIKIFIYKSIEEIASIEMEKPLLEHMDKVKEEERNSGSGKMTPKKEPYKPKPLKPVIITRDEVQKAVYGLGYPSLPTVTIQEFYDGKVKEGIFPDSSKQKQESRPMSLQEQALAGVSRDDDDEAEAAQNEKQIEDDDPITLQRLRDQDEYKDDHRRGWGNRMNRS